MQGLPGGTHVAVCALAGLDAIVTITGVAHAAIAALRRNRRLSIPWELPSSLTGSAISALAW